MIIVYVQHFLSDEGQRIFPQWIVEAAGALAQFAGFVSIRQLTPVDTEKEHYLLLEFESMESFQEWASSQAHNQVMGKLAPFWLRPPAVKTFRVV
jgi:heme-degrading monooxygenase HmoA